MTCTKDSPNKTTSKDLRRKLARQRQWGDIFKALKEKKNNQLRILYAAKSSFKSEEEIEIFSGKSSEISLPLDLS